MKKIPKPPYNVQQALERCVDGIADGGFAMRLAGISAVLTNAESEYEQRGNVGELFAIPPAAAVGEWVDGSEMKKLYTQVFARKGSNARYMYDAIKALAPGGLCPLCSQRPVATLDHYLAKSLHPALAITPLNLVPACKDCNTDTNVRVAQTAGEQTLHPYFDNIDNEIWLRASVVAGAPPALIYFVAPPDAWPQEKKSIVRSHFDTFKLGTLFTTHAAVELVNVYFDLANSASLKSGSDIKAHLTEQAANRRHITRNSWQAAMYAGLADSDWFCNGGYQDVAHSPLLNP